MKRAVIMCEFDRCDKHNRALHGYPCHDCAVEWEAANPRTVQAIHDLAHGKATHADLQRARMLDAAEVAE